MGGLSAHPCGSRADTGMLVPILVSMPGAPPPPCGTFHGPSGSREEERDGWVSVQVGDD
jgi:hypothetical protein